MRMTNYWCSINKETFLPRTRREWMLPVLHFSTAKLRFSSTRASYSLSRCACCHHWPLSEICIVCTCLTYIKCAFCFLRGDGRSDWCYQNLSYVNKENKVNKPKSISQKECSSSPEACCGLVVFLSRNIQNHQERKTMGPVLYSFHPC